VRTDTPKEIILSNPAILSGAPYTTNISADGTGVANAALTLTDGENYFTAISDENGDITLDHTLEPGTVKMIITGFNLNTYYNDSMTIIPPDGAYCIYQNCSFGDDNNDSPEYGENGTLSLDIKNVGNQTAESVTARISTESEYITITNNEETIGNITSNEIINLTNAFGFTIANDIPDQESVVFTISFEGQDTWSSNFTMKINSPVFEFQNISIDDSEGNNNGKLDAGETVTISLPIKNIGHALSEDISLAISTNTDEIITLGSESMELDAINIDELGNATFELTVAENVESGTLANLSFSLESGEYTASQEIALTIGEIVESFESGDLESFAWENGTPGWQVVSAGAQDGTYCIQSVDIDDYQKATISIKIKVYTENQEVKFWKKVSCEDGYYDEWDFLKFSVNGQEQDRWDGEIAWSEEIFVVPSGEVTLTWEYSKDSYESEGSDCAWIDNILLPGNSAITAITTNTIKYSQVTGVSPNPFNPNTTVKYEVNKKGAVELAIYNIKGEKVRTLVNGEKNNGKYEVTWNGKDESGMNCATGIYFSVLKTESGKSAQKMLLMK